MKYTTVLVSLLAVATAANLPHVDIAARDVSVHNEPGHEHTDGSGVEHKRDDLHKRKGASSHTSSSHTSSTHHTTGTGSSSRVADAKSDASALMSLNVGVLVAGVAGAGVGAVFF